MHSAILIRRTRLVSGLILLTFVAGHLTNLLIGIHSLAAMESWRATLVGPWRTAIGEALLLTAALVHASLGLYAIAARRSLAMSRTDVVQLILGLLTPPLLLNHVVATYTAAQVTPNFDATYGMMLAIYWSFSPGYAFQQLFVVMIVWIHAALGLYSWLVLKPIWRRIGGLVLPVLFAVPILALVGFAESGKEVLDKLANDPAWKTHITDNIGRIVKVTSQRETFQAWVLTVYGVLLLIAIGVLAARMLRDRLNPVRIAYDGGHSAQGRRGLSVLELSLLNDIPHSHVCSARGRCGTCRVHVDAGAQSLSAPSEYERAALARFGAGDGDRLACQARVLGPGVSVTRLLPAYADASAARAPQEWVAGARASSGEAAS
ncbi:MAG TPA: 2Fe-2S iron-sulfur cluster-binding protein [Burkholderiales bacterium]|nr:2Fe-2S iron-sulfur cluster-binding protein [Burkholderiales bacterium]